MGTYWQNGLWIVQFVFFTIIYVVVSLAIITAFNIQWTASFVQTMSIVTGIYSIVNLIGTYFLVRAATKDYQIS